MSVFEILGIETFDYAYATQHKDTGRMSRSLLGSCISIWSVDSHYNR